MPNQERSLTTRLLAVIGSGVVAGLIWMGAKLCDRAADQVLDDLNRPPSEPKAERVAFPPEPAPAITRERVTEMNATARQIAGLLRDQTGRLILLGSHAYYREDIEADGRHLLAEMWAIQDERSDPTLDEGIRALEEYFHQRSRSAD